MSTPDARAAETAAEYSDPAEAVFYAIHHAEIPLTFGMLMDRPETEGHSEDAIQEGIEERHLETVEYDGVTAYHLGRESRCNMTITREMYEELRDKSFYIGEDPHGVKVHISEDFRSVGRVKSEDERPDHDTWGPIFPIPDDDEIDDTKPVTDHSSKQVMLEGTPQDTVEISTVHAGMRRVPEQMEVVRRTNTYYGPVLTLIPPKDWVSERTNYRLTCPDSASRLVLWKAQTDHEGYIHQWVKVSRVTAEIRNVAGYDFCASCGEPIKDPMHRGLAATGTCPGGMNDDGGEP